MAQNAIKRLRLNLTVTTPMRFALDDLAERSGLPATTQATMLLRQALDRTMQTERVQQRVRSHNAQRNLATSIEDRTTEHAIESTYEHTQAGTGPDATTQADTAVH